MDRYVVPRRFNEEKLREMNQYDILHHKFTDPKKQEMHERIIKQEADFAHKKAQVRFRRRYVVLLSINSGISLR